MSRSETRITPYRDGPYLIRGPVTLIDQDGQPIVNDRPIIALCRCGKSRNRPFCDGTHKIVGFRATSGPECSQVSEDGKPSGSDSESRA